MGLEHETLFGTKEFERLRLKHDFETKEEAADRADKEGEDGDTWPECKKCHCRRWHVDDDSECKGD